MVLLSQSYVTTGKTIALNSGTLWCFCFSTHSLGLSLLSCQERIVLFYGCSLHPQNLRTQEGETCHYFHLFPFYLLGNNGARCHDLTLVGFLFFFLIFSFKLAFSLSTFILIRRFFSSSSLSAIRVVPSHISGCWFFFCLSWFQLVTHPAWHFTWCAQHIG